MNAHCSVAANVTVLLWIGCIDAKMIKVGVQVENQTIMSGYTKIDQDVCTAFKSAFGHVTILTLVLTYRH